MVLSRHFQLHSVQHCLEEFMENGETKAECNNSCKKVLYSKLGKCMLWSRSHIMSQYAPIEAALQGKE